MTPSKLLIVLATATLVSCGETLEPTPSLRQVVFFDYAGGSGSLFVVNTDGSGYRRITPDSIIIVPGRIACAPDGKHIAFVGVHPIGTELDVWIVAKDGAVKRLTTNPGYDDWPQWIMGGSQLAFLSRTGNNHSSYWACQPDGSNLRKLLPDSLAPSPTMSVSPNGTTLAFVHQAKLTTFDINTSQLRILTPDTLTVSDNWLNVMFSPRGQELAFVANHTSSGGVFTVSTNGTQLRQWVDTSVVWYLNWSPNSSSVSYSSYHGIYAVSMYDGTIRPVVYFSFSDPGRHEWSPDGETIVYEDSQPYVIRFVSSRGGQPRRATTASSGERSPQWNTSIW